MQNKVERYYDAAPLHEWERLDRHRMEFALTIRALRRHLEPGSCVFDVGGGPGRYALALAGDGHRVTLLDLAAANIAFAQEMAVEQGVELEGAIHGNALDLSRWADGSFDAVLLFGPLYHLLDEEDRAKAVREALRVLRPGGLLGATVITRYNALREQAMWAPEDLPAMREVLEPILATGRHHARSERGFTDHYAMMALEFAPWMESFGLATLEVLGQEGLLFLIDQKVNLLDGPVWEAWVELNERYASDPSTWGAAGHLLYLGRKSS